MFWMTGISLFTGVLSAVAVISFRDIIAPMLWERFNERRVYEKYSQPLANFAESLHWRLHEILQLGRDNYLSSRTPGSAFNNYKFVSTCYRLCALIGCIHAIRREQLPFVKHKHKYMDLQHCIFGLETTLADGDHIEEEALRRFAEIAEVNVPDSRKKRQDLAMQFEHIIENNMNYFNLTSREQFNTLDEHEKERFVSDVYRFCCESPDIEAKYEDLMENKNIIINIASARYQHIFRDWQSAIGDIMIRRNKDGLNKYDIIGYREFCAIYESEDFYINNVKQLFSDLNKKPNTEFNSEIPEDYREVQLEGIMKNNARIIVALSSLRFSKNHISQTTYYSCKNLLDQTR